MEGQLKNLNIVKRGQRWQSKDTGKIFILQIKTTSGWQAKPQGQKKTHHIQEYTLFKFYELLK